MNTPAADLIHNAPDVEVDLAQPEGVNAANIRSTCSN